VALKSARLPRSTSAEKVARTIDGSSYPSSAALFASLNVALGEYDNGRAGPDVGTVGLAGAAKSGFSFDKTVFRATLTIPMPVVSLREWPRGCINTSCR